MDRPLSTTERNRLNGLRNGYRAAFREWISARNTLTAPYQGADDESEVETNEANAALAYRSARNALTDEMAHLALQRSSGNTNGGLHPMVKSERTEGPTKVTQARGWGWDFGLILLLITLTVGTAKVLADLASTTK